MVEPQNTMGITVHAAAAFGDENCFKKGTVQKKKKKKRSCWSAKHLQSWYSLPRWKNETYYLSLVLSGLCTTEAKE